MHEPCNYPTNNKVELKRVLTAVALKLRRLAEEVERLDECRPTCIQNAVEAVHASTVLHQRSVNTQQHTVKPTINAGASGASTNC